MFAMILALASAMAAAAPGQHVAEGQVSEGVVRAWKVAGADVRWVAVSGLWGEEPTPGCRVGFRFHGWLPGRFADLPAPEAPFHLDVSFPWPGDGAAAVATEITDGGLRELVKFQRLQSLEIFGRGVTDVGMLEVAKLKNLEWLDLSCTKVTATGLKSLAPLRFVTRLSLSQMDVTEETLGAVAGFVGLTRFHLSFNKSRVTAAGVGHLAKLQKLRKLGFFRVDLSDADARGLGRSKSLRDIDFLNTTVTKAGAAELRALLPGCDVSARTVDLTDPPPPQVPKD